MDGAMPGSGVCWTLVRRRAVDEMLDLLLFYGDLVNSRGYALSWGGCFKTRASYYSAAARLKKQGLIARRGDRYGPSQLVALREAHDQRPAFYKPERFWQRRWNGIWFMLMYDVPESKRVYRDSLRTFLKRRHLGCLQRSVWVTPDDVRADYADLCTASDVDQFSVLMEGRTVLGLTGQELAARAWNFSRLRSGHQWYLNTFKLRLQAVQLGRVPAGRVIDTVREEMSAFVMVMQEDPLLPNELYPPNYLGPEVLAFHREFIRVVGEAGRRLLPASKPARATNEQADHRQ